MLEMVVTVNKQIKGKVSDGHRWSGGIEKKYVMISMKSGLLPEFLTHEIIIPVQVLLS